jgi:MFS family permease
MDRAVVILRNTGHGVNDLFWFVIPSMLPVILEQFDMRYGTAGALLTAFLSVIAVFSFILGKASDRIPRYLIMGCGFLVASIFLIGASVMSTLGSFVVFILIAGIGVSSYHPTVYAYIDETTESRKGAVFGMFEFWGSLAIFAMFILHGLLLRSLSWRNIILVTSLPGLVIGVLYLSYSGRFRSQQSSYAQQPDGQSRLLLPFVLFLVVITFRFFGIMAVVSFTPTYLVRELGLQVSVASYATGIYFLGGLIFTPILGRACDRYSPSRVLLATTGLAFPLILLMSVPGPLWTLPIYLFLIGICYYGAGPAMNMLVLRMSSTLRRGEAFGYYTALTAVAFSFSPLTFGIIADRAGLRSSMRLFSFPLLISAVVLVVMTALMTPRRRVIPRGSSLSAGRDSVSGANR